MKYKINEIFHSIQGEGSMTGQSAIFVRFSGCNLKCDFCDTDFADYKKMYSWEILEEALTLDSTETNVIFTGGEPMLQLDKELIRLFKLNGYFIAVETNGTIKIPKDFMIDHITVSPKFQFLNAQKQKAGTDLKILVGEDGADLNLDKIKESYDFKNYYLQPIDTEDDPQNYNTQLAILLVTDNPFWKLSVQVQKLLKIR